MFDFTASGVVPCCGRKNVSFFFFGGGGGGGGLRLLFKLSLFNQFDYFEANQSLNRLLH